MRNVSVSVALIASLSGCSLDSLDALDAAEQASSFLPVAGSYQSAGGPDNSTDPETCRIAHVPAIVSDVTNRGYVVTHVFEDFSFSLNCSLQGHSASCNAHHSSDTIDLRPELDAVLTFSGATSTVWTSATSFNLHDQGLIRCAGADCAAAGFAHVCALNGVQHFELE